nr:putative disease resistance protein rga3 [Quercus suber]
MQELEKWPEVRCPSLSRLKFSNCPKLRELPQLLSKVENFEDQKLQIPKGSSSGPKSDVFVRGERASLSTLLSLTLLSIRNCPMPKLTEELPATLECLSIGSCPFLQSLGPKEILKSLPSLKDLYIEDCPMLQSLPEDGLPSSLQPLQIQRCPLLTERCQMEEGGGGGPDRPKVMHIPDLEIDFPTASSTSA